MKSPDEIKKGLECCAMSSYRCEDDCPYREQCRYEQGGKAMNEDALALIQQLEAQVHRWISVKEMLPEIRDWVLVIGEFVPEGGWFVPHIAEYYLDRWRLDVDECSSPEERSIKVTHWMPLPEPPKEE